MFSPGDPVYAGFRLLYSCSSVPVRKDPSVVCVNWNEVDGQGWHIMDWTAGQGEHRHDVCLVMCCTDEMISDKWESTMDAFCLGRLLARDDISVAEALLKYEEKRKSSAEKIVQTSSRAGRIYTATGVKAILRNFMLPFLTKTLKAELAEDPTAVQDVDSAATSGLLSASGPCVVGRADARPDTKGCRTARPLPMGRALPRSLSDADRGVTSEQRRRWRAGRRARVRRLSRHSRAVRQLHALLMPSRQLRGDSRLTGPEDRTMSRIPTNSPPTPTRRTALVLYFGCTLDFMARSCAAGHQQHQRIDDRLPERG